LDTSAKPFIINAVIVLAVWLTAAVIFRRKNLDEEEAFKSIRASFLAIWGHR
jgi:hypothetical protein